MQKSSFLLAITLVLSSCGSLDEQPITETILIAGETEQNGVAYSHIGVNYLFSDVQSLNGLLVSQVAIDLDKDGQEDLQFELSSGTQEDIQMLMVRSLHTTLISEGTQEHHVQMKQANELADANSMTWLNNEWLFLHYAKTGESWTAAPIVQQSGFLPLQLESNEGWLEIQLLMDAQQTKVWGLNIKQLALKE